NQRYRGEKRLLIGNRVVHSRGVNERLKDRAGGALGDRVIELAERIVASAYKRQHLASVRVQSHQRHLRNGAGENLRLVFVLGNFDSSCTQLFHILINFLDGRAHRVGRRPLQGRIDGGVNTVPA